MTTLPARNLGLDALRGLAVIFMVQQHLLSWLYQGFDQQFAINWFAQIPIILFAVLGGVAAPLFITLAGIGAMFLVNAELHKRRHPDLLLLQRGLLILGFGYLLNVLTPSWFSPLSWFVLHLMATGFLLMPLLRRMSTLSLLLLGLLMLLLTGPLQALLDTPAFMNNHRMGGWAVIPVKLSMPVSPVAEWLPYAFVRLALIEGQFPVFPWLSFFLLGVVVGRWIMAEQVAVISRSIQVLLVLGGSTLALWLFVQPPPGSLLWRSVRVPLVFFPSTMTLSFLLMASVLFITRWGILRQQAKPFSEQHALVILGRASLTILILHVVIFRELATLAGLNQSLNAEQLVLFVIVIMVFTVLLCRYWQSRSYRYGFEWLLRSLCSQRDN